MPERFLDVSHEALIRGWPRLRRWLDEDRAGLRLQRRITEAAEEWQLSNRDDDLLYRGARLIQAQEWRERHEVELNPLEREFLDASIVLKQRLEEHEKEQQQRELEAAQKLAEAERRRAEETSEVASRGNVSLARYSKERGKNVQALAYLAQALRLNPENREATGITAAMLTQLSRHVPLTVRHEAVVRSAQFSPDGQRVVTASEDNTARVWDAANGKQIGEPMEHKGFVRSAQFSPDGQRVVTASEDNTARLWDAANGKQIGEPMEHKNAVYSAQFSPDGQRVVTASRDYTARLWDAASGKQIGEPMEHKNAVYSAQFSPDGQRVVTASRDYIARLWDAASGKQIGDPMEHKNAGWSAQFSADGQRVVTASYDRTARLWDAATGKQVGEPMEHKGFVNSAQFSPDGQRVVTASNDNTARLWDAASDKPIGEPMEHKGFVWSAQFSPDGQRVVTASNDNTARLWDAASGKQIGEPMEHKGAVFSAQFSPDGQRVVTASEDNTARLWDAVIVTDMDTKEDIFLLAELAEATGGVTLETVGQAENFKSLTPEQVIASREKIAAKFLRPPLKMTPLQRFLKWSVLDCRNRTISPLSQVTVSEWLENMIKEGTVEGLRAAMQVDPANARITAHLGRRLADYAFKEGGDPAGEEADFLTSRALKLTPDNDEVKKLRDEAIKLLELKSRREKMASVFISYAREDQDFVHRLEESLKTWGREVRVDREGVRPTEEFRQAIYGAIEGADTFIFVLTPDSLASITCGREIAYAAAHNKRMVPIIARDVNADTVPKTLAELNWIFFRDTDDFERAIDTLISALDTDLKWVHAHTRLLTRASEWNANGKNNRFVLRGDDLRSAERWLLEAGAQKERQPTALQTEYIMASKAAARR